MDDRDGEPEHAALHGSEHVEVDGVGRRIERHLGHRPHIPARPTHPGHGFALVAAEDAAFARRAADLLCFLA
jgi:hypothetical protein